MINRPLQMQILMKMDEKFPDTIDMDYKLFTEAKSYDDLRYNMAYLLLHEFIADAETIPMSAGDTPLKQSLRSDRIKVKGYITQNGIDFLAEDGGLSAIRNVVTVKFHAETIRELIDVKIIQSDKIPQEDKPVLREALKNMKEEGLKQLTTRLISYGLDQGAITAQQLGQWMST